MLTVKQWFEYNSIYSGAYKAYLDMGSNCTMATFNLIQPIANMCGISNVRTKFVNYMRDNLIDEACITEIGLNYEQCKERSVHDKSVRKPFERIKQFYRQKIPAQLFYLAKDKDWFKLYISNIYNTLSKEMTCDCAVEKFTTYKEIGQYCYVYGKVYGEEKGIILKKKVDAFVDEMKNEGCARVYIIGKIAEFLKSVEV